MKLSNKTGNVIGEVLVDEEQDLMILTSIGKMIRVDMQSIRKAGRNTSGVIIVSVEKGDKVVSIAKCPKEDKELDDENLDENGEVVKNEENSEVNNESSNEENSNEETTNNEKTEDNNGENE